MKSALILFFLFLSGSLFAQSDGDSPRVERKTGRTLPNAAVQSGNPKLFDFAFLTRESHKYNGRKLNTRNCFPNSVIDKHFKLSEPHHSGLILGGSWWDLQKRIGAVPAQQLLFEAFHLMPAAPNFSKRHLFRQTDCSFSKSIPVTEQPQADT